ncbi:protein DETOXIFICATION 35-like isoform X2 [Salvia hispanica]|uniref:protein DETOXIFICATION 35-like isoform X2 n=1 Tax=Salvia hispanica TaxID=49212 RepID=UPI002009A39B|nr:protein DETOXIFICATION 35-like isoform X2 [Salvia hispanica]
MEAPLLEGGVDLIGYDGDYVAVKGLKSWWRLWCIESAKLWKIGGPIAFQIVCQFGMTSATTVFVGHLGDIQLSAFSIALSVVSTFAFGFLLGMGSALETLCGQAFGSGEVEMLGVYMQRSIVILLGTCALLSPLYIFATPILRLLGQKEEIAAPAGVYTLMILPQLCSLAITFPTQKFLQAQSKVSVLAWIAAFSLAFHILLCWLFVCVLGWGTTAAAVAFDLTSWGTAIAQFVYVVGWCKDGWRGFSWAAFHEVWGFLKLSLASAVMLCLEIWYMMSIIILTGHLDDAVTAVGSLSICVRVSNELGMGHPRAARYAVYVTLLQSLAIGIVCMILVLATRNHIALIFTDSQDMQSAVARLSGLLGITMLLNSIQPVVSGVAIGGGWQAQVAYINLACYYVFGLPLGYVLGYVANLGVVGLWGGMIAGVGLQTLLLLLLLYRTNWNKEVEQTTERLRKWGGQQIKSKIPINHGI